MPDSVESSDEAAEADPVDANPQDLALAVKAIGAKARYGGLLSCALAGIYAERERNAAVRADCEAEMESRVAQAVADTQRQIESAVSDERRRIEGSRYEMARVIARVFMLAANPNVPKSNLTTVAPNQTDCDAADAVIALLAAASVPVATPEPPTCTCDGAVYFTPLQNAARKPFLRSPDCPVHSVATPEPTVEIGGQVMTVAQYNAAQYPLLIHPSAEPCEWFRSTPDSEAMLADERAHVAATEAAAPSQPVTCKWHGYAHRHYVGTSDATGGYWCPGPVSLKESSE